MIIDTNNLQEIRNQIQKIKKTSPRELIIIKASDEEFNRKVLELKGVDVLLAPEQNKDRDKLKQRSSGLNEFLCRLAKKNNISIAIDMDFIQKLDKKDKARILARIRQNIDLCKRTKTKMILYPIGKYKKFETQSFFKSLGGSTEHIY